LKGDAGSNKSNTVTSSVGEGGVDLDTVRQDIAISIENKAKSNSS